MHSRGLHRGRSARSPTFDETPLSFGTEHGRCRAQWVVNVDRAAHKKTGAAFGPVVVEDIGVEPMTS